MRKPVISKSAMKRRPVIRVVRIARRKACKGGKCKRTKPVIKSIMIKRPVIGPTRRIIRKPSQKTIKKASKAMKNTYHKIRKLKQIAKKTPKGSRRALIKRQIMKHKIIRGGKNYAKTFINKAKKRIQKY